MNKRRLETHDIHVGLTLPWNLYNASGKCLFKKGFIIHTDETIRKMTQLELFIEDSAPATARVAGQRPSPSSALPELDIGRYLDSSEALPFKARRLAPPANHVFSEIAHFVAFLELFYTGLIAGERELIPDFLLLINRIQDLLQRDSDSCLAAVHVYYDFPQSLLQPVYCALLCEFLGKLMYVEPNHYKRLVASALTANIGMYEYYDQLVNQKEPLSPEQWAQVRRHPQIGCECLRRVGIQDALWLKIIEQHHERCDGQGYPHGLSRDEILVEASISGIADTYLSLIAPKAYRSRQEPIAALQSMLKMSIADDSEILNTFFHASGVFPPGSIVELIDGTIGLVLKRHDKTTPIPPTCIFATNSDDRLPNTALADPGSALHQFAGIYHGKLPPNIRLHEVYRTGLRLLSRGKPEQSRP